MNGRGRARKGRVLEDDRLVDREAGAGGRAPPITNDSADVGGPLPTRPAGRQSPGGLRLASIEGAPAAFGRFGQAGAASRHAWPAPPPPEIFYTPVNPRLPPMPLAMPTPMAMPMAMPMPMAVPPWLLLPGHVPGAAPPPAPPDVRALLALSAAVMRAGEARARALQATVDGLESRLAAAPPGHRLGVGHGLESQRLESQPGPLAAAAALPAPRAGRRPNVELEALRARAAAAESGLAAERAAHAASRAALAATGAAGAAGRGGWGGAVPETLVGPSDAAAAEALTAEVASLRALVQSLSHKLAEAGSAGNGAASDGGREAIFALRMLKEPDWKCFCHKTEFHDGAPARLRLSLRPNLMFISYRVSSELAFALALAKELGETDRGAGKGKAVVYIDKTCLNDGEARSGLHAESLVDYEQGFLHGIAGAGLIVLLISNFSLSGIAANAHLKQDNVLIEMEVALARHEEHKATVLPLFVPEFKDGAYIPFRFPSSTEFADAMHASPLSNSNIRGTMEKVLKLQGQQVTEHNVDSAMEHITRVLDQFSVILEPGGKKSIADAIREAKKGDKILLKPGIFRESINLRDLVLDGDGDAEVFIMGQKRAEIMPPDGHGAFIISSSEVKVVLDGIIIRCESTSPVVALAFESGAHDVNDCTITCTRGEGAFVSGGAKVSFSSCMWENCLTFGLCVSDDKHQGSKATVSDKCAFVNCPQRAIAVVNRGSAELDAFITFKHCGIGIWTDRSVAVEEITRGPFKFEDVAKETVAGEYDAVVRPGQSLQRAISDAHEGVRILMWPGVYRESIELDGTAPSGITLSGEGLATLEWPPGESGTVVASSGTGAVIEGITIRCLLKTVPDASEIHGASDGAHTAWLATPAAKATPLRVTAGDLIVRRCNFTSHTSAAVSVEGEKSRPSFEDCKVFSSFDDGFVFSDKSGGSIRNTTVTECNGIGISLLSGASPTIDSTDIRSCRGGGVLCEGEGTQGHFSSCRLTSNAVGVSIGSGAEPAFSFVRIIESQSHGIIFEGGACGRVTNSEIRASGECGLLLRGGANPSVTGCEVKGSQHVGVSISGEGTRGRILDNEIFSSVRSNIVVEDKASPVLSANRVQSSCEAGIKLLAGTAARVENNEVSSNARIGILLEATAEGTVVTGNKIRACVANGIVARRGALGRVTTNTIEGNGRSGVKVEEAGTDILMEDNTISSNGAFGVYVTDSARCTLRHNIISDQHSGIVAELGAEPTVDETNAISNCRAMGILVRKGGSAAKIARLANNTCSVDAVIDPEAKTTGPAGPEVYDGFVEPWESIGAALEMVCPSGRVLLRPGLHRGYVQLGFKEVHLHGESKATIKCIGVATVSSSSPTSSVVGCVLSSTPHATARITVFVDAVKIWGGGLLLSKCDVSASTGSAVFVTGTASGRLIKNLLHASEYGLKASGESKAVLEENDIFSCRLGGAYVDGAAAPTLTRNTVHDNNGAGLLATGSAAPRLIECDVYNNKGAGVDCLGLSAVALLRNTIRDGFGNGLRFHESARGTTEGNFIHRNRLASVLIKDNADPALSGDKISDGWASGVEIRDGGRGSLTECVLEANKGVANIEILNGSTPILTACSILRAPGFGVLVSGKAQGGLVTLQKCNLSFNECEGVLLKGGANVALAGCTIEDNEDFGVQSQDLSTQCSIRECVVRRNFRSGIAVTAGASVVCERNRISANLVFGVYFAKDGRGDVKNNEVFDHARSGIVIEETGNPNVELNDVHDNGEVGIWVRKGGKGTIDESNNIMRFNGRRNLLIDPNGMRTLQLENSETGDWDVEVSPTSPGGFAAALDATPPGGRLLLRRGVYSWPKGGAFDPLIDLTKDITIIGESWGLCRLTDEGDDSRGWAVLESRASDETRGTLIRSATERATVQNVWIRVLGTKGHALDVFSGSITVEGCRLEAGPDCLTSVVLVRDKSTPTLKKNVILGSAISAIVYSGTGAGGSLESNTICRSLQSGVEVKQGAAPNIVDNNIHRNAQAGIFFSSKGFGKVLRNRIHDNAYSGIELRDASEPIIGDNDIFENGDKGVWLFDAAGNCQQGELTNHLRNNPGGGWVDNRKELPIEQDVKNLDGNNVRRGRGSRYFCGRSGCTADRPCENCEGLTDPSGRVKAVAPGAGGGKLAFNVPKSVHPHTLVVRYLRGGSRCDVCKELLMIPGLKRDDAVGGVRQMRPAAAEDPRNIAPSLRLGCAMHCRECNYDLCCSCLEKQLKPLPVLGHQHVMVSRVPANGHIPVNGKIVISPVDAAIRCMRCDQPCCEIYGRFFACKDGCKGAVLCPPCFLLLRCLSPGTTVIRAAQWVRGNEDGGLGYQGKLEAAEPISDASMGDSASAAAAVAHAADARDAWRNLAELIREHLSAKRMLLLDLFDDYDADNDGTLSADELALMVKALRPGVAESDVSAITAAVSGESASYNRFAMLLNDAVRLDAVGSGSGGEAGALAAEGSKIREEASRAVTPETKALLHAMYHAHRKYLEDSGRKLKQLLEEIDDGGKGPEHRSNVLNGPKMTALVRKFLPPESPPATAEAISAMAIQMFRGKSLSYEDVGRWLKSCELGIFPQKNRDGVLACLSDRQDEVRFYCGRKDMYSCSRNCKGCGPTSGCQCPACAELTVHLMGLHSLQHYAPPPGHVVGDGFRLFVRWDDDNYLQCYDWGLNGNRFEVWIQPTAVDDPAIRAAASAEEIAKLRSEVNVLKIPRYTDFLEDLADMGAVGDASVVEVNMSKLGLLPNHGPMLAKALTVATCRRLTLNDNPLMSNASMFFIAEALKRNKVVTGLYLNRCGVGDEGIRALCEGLKQNEAIESLSVGGGENYGLSDEGVPAVVEMLRVNKKIKQMQFNNNKLSEKGAQDIKAAWGDRGRGLELYALGNDVR